ncbi:MAG: hypothetical protein ABJA98_35370 [Acidobacteriota bacterium]
MKIGRGYAGLPKRLDHTESLDRIRLGQTRGSRSLAERPTLAGRHRRPVRFHAAEQTVGSTLAYINTSGHFRGSSSRMSSGRSWRRFLVNRTPVQAGNHYCGL